MREARVFLLDLAADLRKVSAHSTEPTNTDLAGFVDVLDDLAGNGARPTPLPEPATFNESESWLTAAMRDGVV